MAVSAFFAYQGFASLSNEALQSTKLPHVQPGQSCDPAATLKHQNLPGGYRTMPVGASHTWKYGAMPHLCFIRPILHVKVQTPSSQGMTDDCTLHSGLIWSPCLHFVQRRIWFKVQLYTHRQDKAFLWPAG